MKSFSTIERIPVHGQVEHIVEALDDLGNVVSKPFFGGVALLLDGIQFGFYVRSELHFRVDDGNRAEFEKSGSVPFQYSHANGKIIIVKSFYTVPDSALDDRHELCRLARGACAAGMRLDVAKRSKATPKVVAKGVSVRKRTPKVKDA